MRMIEIGRPDKAQMNAGLVADLYAKYGENSPIVQGILRRDMTGDYGPRATTGMTRSGMTDAEIAASPFGDNPDLAAAWRAREAAAAPPPSITAPTRTVTATARR
jgi:hypothetical protein